jgi:hypothetical protein
MRAQAPAAFFDSIRTEVSRAEAEAGEVIERWFRIAGVTLLARFIGRALDPYLTPALGHLEIPDPGVAPDFTLQCWDCASLGLAFPPAPVAIASFTPRGDIRGFNGGGFHAAFEPGGRQLSLLDEGSRQAVFCAGDAAGIPRFEFAEPIRALLSWMMRAHGRQLIHAAAVGTARGGALLIGRSGAGKSNTAIGCLNSPLKYAADDFCAVAAQPTPTVYSLYSTGKTRESDWARHPFLADLQPDLDPAKLEKAIYFLHRACPAKLIAEFPLKAILLPRRGGETCETRPVSPATVLQLTAPDTSVLLPGAGAEVMRCMATLVRAVPCYDLQLGPRPEAIAGVIEAAIAAATA